MGLNVGKTGRPVSLIGHWTRVEVRSDGLRLRLTVAAQLVPKLVDRAA